MFGGTIDVQSTGGQQYLPFFSADTAAAPVSAA
jgi:hypothetical protein